MGMIEEGLRLSAGEQPIDDVFRRLAALGVQAIPVTSTDREEDYQKSVRTIAALDGRGICIRASLEDFSDELARAELEFYIAAMGVPHSEIDFIIDCRSIVGTPIGILRTFISTSLAIMPNVDRYRTFTLLSGAFPINLSGLSPGLNLLPRNDLALWQSIRSPNGIRQPSFGDYCASNPDQEEVDPRMMSVSASIRYASDKDWVIAKGRALRNQRFGGSGQFYSLSQTLRSYPAFTGAGFSWASNYIDQCANGSVGPGNLTTWRKVATNRHLAYTAHQIANLP